MYNICRSFAPLLWVALAGSAAASSLDALSSQQAAAGLRAALSQGVDVAVSQLGKSGGFLNDPKVAIPLPHPLDKAESVATHVGHGQPGR